MHLWLLVAQAKQHDPAVLGRWVDTDVAETDVEGDEHALFPADVDELRVRSAGQFLVGDGAALVAVRLEQVLGGGGDVLVDLDLHEVADRA